MQPARFKIRCRYHDPVPRPWRRGKVYSYADVVRIARRAGHDVRDVGEKGLRISGEGFDLRLVTVEDYEQ